MTKYHAVMIDETGCEFGVDIEAPDYGTALTLLLEDYPESACVQLESPEDARRREEAMYRRLEAEMDGEFWEA